MQKKKKKTNISIDTFTCVKAKLIRFLLYIHSTVIVIVSKFCWTILQAYPRGKGAMMLTLHEALTRKTRPDHDTGNYVPYSFRQVCGFLTSSAIIM